MAGSLNSTPRELENNDNKVVRGCDKADDINLSKKSKNVKSGIQTHVRAMGEPTFLNPSAKEVFN